MDKVLLIRNNKGFSWQRTENLAVKGYLFDRSGHFFDGSQLLDYFSGIESLTDLDERVSYANGCFTVIFSKEDELYVASDPVRAFPVFYTRLKAEWIISDDADEILKKIETPARNEIAWQEFLAAGYVTGDETLISGLSQVQAGELIQFKKDDLKKKFFYSYRTHISSEGEYDELRTAGISVMEDTFKRFTGGLKGRTVIVPLSGGFDSRMIAVMLKKSGYSNVVCLTYGRPGNPEMKVSQKVAEILGFKWICVEYTEELIRGYLNDSYFRDYYPFASNLVSMFYLQEYFAIRYLKE